MKEDKNEELTVNTVTMQTENQEVIVIGSVGENPLEKGNMSNARIFENGAEINNKLAALGERFEHLAAEFESKFKYDQFKEKIIDDMHRELQDYKNDWVKNLLRPMVMDIIHAIDDIAKLVNSHRSTAPTELDPQKLIKQMEGLSFDLIDILSRQGIEPFQDPQPEFDPKRQKIIKIESCNDPDKDKHIAQRVQSGYSWDGKVLRQEKVNVYVFEPGIESPQIHNIEEKE